jgi:ACR3 family arsenite transporter
MLTKVIHNAAQYMSGQGTAVFLIVAIFLGSAMGTLIPQAGNTLSINVDYMIIMLVFFLLFEVRIQDVVVSLKQTRFIFVALVINFIVIPVLAFAISSMFLSGHPLLFVGLLIYFMSPCTDWFLGFTRLAKGNTALGAALLPINMLVQLLMYPVYLQIFGIDTINSGAGDVFQTLWQWFFVPLISALVLRLLLERMLNTKRFELVQSGVALSIPVLLAGLVAQISAVNIGTLIAHVNVVPLILGAIFLFFTLTFLLSEIISKVMKLPYEDHVLMTMTTAARNAPLMIALTVAVIPNQPIIYAAIIIGMVIELPHLVALKVIFLKRSNEMYF